MEGFRTALIIASGLCAATAVISYVLPGPQADGSPAPDEDALERRLAIMEEESEVVGAGLMLSDEQVSVASEAQGR